MSAHPLYMAAEQAEEHYTAVLNDVYGSRDARWHGMATSRYPEVLAAYNRKVDADAKWLDFMRADSLARSARR